MFWWIPLGLVTVLAQTILSHDTNGAGNGALTEDGCFEQHPSSTIKCVSHYERHSDISDEQCRKLCVEQSPTCQAAVYCKTEQTCDLYDVLPTEPTAPATTTPRSNGNGGGNGGGGYSSFRSWAKRRFRRYVGQQSSFQQPNNYQQQQQQQQNNYQQQQQQQQQQQHQTGYQQQNQNNNNIQQPGVDRPDGYRNVNGVWIPWVKQASSSSCSSGEAILTPDPDCTAYRQTGACAGSGIATTTSDTTGSTDSSTGTSSTTTFAMTKISSTESTTTESTTTTGTTSTTATTGSLPDEALCADDEVVRFVEVPFTEIDSQEAGFDAASESECYGACEDNELPDGTQVPCRSVNYYNDGACTLTLDTIEDGGTPSENTQSTYYEKICLPADIYSDCNGPFLRLPDKLLTGFARQVLTVDSLAECEAACVNSQAEFGFDCLSGNYVGDDDEFNCVLTDEDTNSVPDLLTDDFEGGLVYFEPRCSARRFNRRSHVGGSEKPMFSKVNQWGPWTYCDPRTNKQMRFRRCKSPKPSDCAIQTRKCKGNFKLNRRRKNQDPERCNVRETCCPLIKPNGRKNCRIGRIFTSAGRQSCKPSKC